MQIRNHSNNTFSGGFRFSDMPANSIEKLPELAKKGKQIFYDFEKKGDVFVVLRDKLDNRMKNFISSEDLKFEYYPTINCKSGLDSEKPDLLSALIKKVEKPISTMKDLTKILSEKNRVKQTFSEEKQPDYLKNILSALFMDTSLVINKTTKNGVKIIEDKEFARKILISPPSKHDIHFVLVQPESISKESSRYAISSDGKILARYSSTEGLETFRKNFEKSLIKKK